MSPSPALVWYASYGSNMCADRFACYLAGGVPLGASRGHAGCRDRRAPLSAVPYELPGGVYFATESAVWGGGRAFYDRDLPGGAAARAYLITAGQFADILSQEMHRPTGADLDLTTVRAAGRVELGPGRYETLLYLGDLGKQPLLTFTAPWRATDVRWRPPSAPYLRVLKAGLREAHGWTDHRIGTYLASLPGARGHWTAPDIAALPVTR
ncbi:MAG TPA: histone deacetylase [Pseudonocardiaceae bacterium]|nr:histone deacetylase [Pseudonocardiaceae bacterium]